MVAVLPRSRRDGARGLLRRRGLNGPTFAPGGASFLLPGDAVGCLLLHGYSAMPEELRALGEHLHTDGRTVVGLRLPGHGTHPRHLARVRWADHLAAVADAVGLLRQAGRRVVVIGTSMGGVLALSSAGFGVDGIVAVATPSEPFRLRSRVRSLPPRLQRKGVAVDPGAGIRRERDYPAYAAEPTRQTFELHRGIVAMRRSLGSVSCPVLLVHSDADPYFPPTAMATLARLLERAPVETVLVHGLGHGLLYEPGADAVFATIGEFVRRVGGSG